MRQSTQAKGTVRRRRAAESRRSGENAEDLAADYLASRGLALLARNVRCKGGELDLVCSDRGTLVVVEVRQRARSDFGGALASVAPAKQRRIIRATRFLLHTHREWRGWRLRFDVFGVQGPPDGRHAIAWVRDAFRAGRRC
ncbi:MAG TPA: YraN family protein [Steroidobacteraceae bacterium]|nr:YraN family protein [Steroidobacteraceae bacterium]